MNEDATRPAPAADANHLDAERSVGIVLTPLWPTVLGLARLSSSRNAELPLVARLVATDPALTGALIRRANSIPHIGLEPVGTVLEALQRLGLDATLELALEAASDPPIAADPARREFDEWAFWRHCNAAAIAAEQLRLFYAQVALPPETATAALLHDVGTMVLARSPLARIAPTPEGAEANVPPGVADLAIDLRPGHCEVGRRIATDWCLPEPFLDGILHHHDPERIQSPMVDAIHVADLVAGRVSPMGASPSRLPDPGVLERLGIDPGSLSNLCDFTAEVLQRQERMARGLPEPGDGASAVRTSP